MMERARRIPMVAAVAGLLLAAGPVAAQAQDAGGLQDGRWLPFLGCWVAEEATAGPLVCVVPEAQGVALLTVAGEEITDERVLSDGSERAVAVPGCTGSEAAAFSEDGHRVYTRSSLICSGLERETRGLIAVVDENRWIEIRALGVADGGAAWVRRYRPAPADRITAELAERLRAAAPGHAVEAARMAASGPITVDDVIEAHARTASEAVRAWIAEQGDPMRLDADRLIRLAEAGVPADVIDVAVAVSFPEHFSVAEEPRREDARARRYGLGSWSPYGPYFHDPFYYDPFYYGMYGYGYYGAYSRGFYGPRYYTPTVLVVTPVRSAPTGRVVNGRGYTRNGSGSRGTATRPSVRALSPASGSGSAVSRGGYSGSSSSSSSKGKAKPRSGGG